jgi:hypothetical protein
VPPAGASLAVFHSPQDGQCPNQRGCSLPQAVQKKLARAAFAALGLMLLFMAFSCGASAGELGARRRVCRATFELRAVATDAAPSVGSAWIVQA